MAHRGPFWSFILTGRLCLSLLLPAAAAEEAEAAPITFGIYTTAQMAGKATGRDPLTGLTQEASYLKVASAMAQERASTGAVLLLDAGNAAATRLAGARGASAALALRAIGYDAFVPGSGESYLSSREQAALSQTLGDTSDGARPVSVLSANGGDAAYQVFPLKHEQQDLTVGVLGLGDMEPGTEEGSYTWAWNEEWKTQMKQAGCQLTVVVCDAGPETLAQFAAQTSGIDLLVSGRGDAAVTSFANKDGEAVPCVSAGGTALTRTAVSVAPDGKVTVGESVLLDLARYEPDKALADTLSEAQSAAQSAALQAVGTITGDWKDEGPRAYSQTAASDAVGNALLWASGADVALLSPASMGGADLSASSQDKEGEGKLTARDCALLLPDTTPVVKIELTAGQLRAWLETCAEQYTVSETDRTLSGGSGADVAYGLDYEVNLGDPAGERVSALTLDGEILDDGEMLEVAVSSSRLADPAFPAATPLWSAAADRRFNTQGGSAAVLLAAYAGEQTRLYDALAPDRASTWTIYPGTSEGPLDRLEFVTLLYELAGKPMPGADAAFIDVTNDRAVVWAAETGVVSGNGQGKFFPDQTITREQAAVMIYNYAKSQSIPTPTSGPSVTSLTDYKDISTWARPAVEFCIRTGALPAQDGKFLPQGTLSHTEAKTYLAVLSK